MKNYTKLVLLSIMVISLTMNSCTENFEEMNIDPNTISSPSPELLLPGAMKTNLDITGGVANFWMYLQYGRYLGGLNGTEFANFGISDGFVDNYWSRYYRECIKPVRIVQDLWTGDPEYVNRVQIAKALEAWTFSVALSTWGPVPITEAVEDAYFNIPFDSELDGYTFILDKLTEARDMMLATESEDVLTADPMFGGNNEQWLKFINTLRLKIALRISGSSEEALSNLGKTHISAVVTNDLDNLILDNADNASLSWSGFSVDNYSFMYDRTEINANDNWEPRLGDELITFFNAYKDPRITSIAKPSQKPLVAEVEIDSSGTTILVSYAVPYLGSPVGGDQPFAGWDLINIENPLADANLDTYSELNDDYTKQDSEFMIISASETLFMLAEIMARNYVTLPSPASVYYQDGIRLSFERYGVSGTEDYLSQPGIAYNSASTEGQILNNWTSSSSTKIEANEGIKQIVIQRWITMFFQGNDAWCLQKRTNLLPWAPYMNPALRNEPMDYPERMVYSQIDKNVAPDQYQEAINNFLGGQDNLTTPIAMNALKVPVDWEDFVPEWSSDLAKGWYGNSISELEANGLVDVTGQPNADEALANGTGYIRITE